MPRANWHLDVHVDHSDPFLAAPTLDLAAPDLHMRLAELLRAEGRLYERGITCPIKDRADTCCSACPLRGTHRTQPIRELCELGCEQERALMDVVINA